MFTQDRFVLAKDVVKLVPTKAKTKPSIYRQILILIVTYDSHNNFVYSQRHVHCK